MRVLVGAAIALGLIWPMQCLAICDDAQIVVSTTPAPQVEPGAVAKAMAQLGSIDINGNLLLLGNSLAEKWRDDISRDFPDRAVVNLGVGGDKTQNTLWCLERIQHGQFQPRYIVLFVGTNNLNAKSAVGCGVAAGVEAVIEKRGLSGLQPGFLLFRYCHAESGQPSKAKTETLQTELLRSTRARRPWLWCPLRPRSRIVTKSHEGTTAARISYRTEYISHQTAISNSGHFFCWTDRDGHYKH